MPRLSTLAAVVAVLVPFVLPAIAASDRDAPEIRSVETDPYGNAVLRTRGGAKIIVVGEGARLAEEFAPVPIVKAEQHCRTVGIIVRGRSHMYGVSSGDPVPVLSKTICD